MAFFSRGIINRKDYHYKGLTIGSYVLKAVVEYGGASDAESSIGLI